MSRKDVPNHSTRIIRYELDQMADDEHFLWRPYRDLGVDSLPSLVERGLWLARCPMIFNDIVEWCYTDRVARQFGRVQDIPDPPEYNHTRLHSIANEGFDWPIFHAQLVHLWMNRSPLVLSLHRHPPIRKRTCIIDYGRWFMRVTRRFIGNPSASSSQHCFQGTQGHAQFYLEGMSQAYHAPDIPEARAILRDRMTATGQGNYGRTQPSQQPTSTSEPHARRRETGTGRRRGRPRVQRVDPMPGTYYGEVLPSPVHDQDDSTTRWDDWSDALLQDQTQYIGGGTWDAGGGSGSSHVPLFQEGSQDLHSQLETPFQTDMTGGGTWDIGGDLGPSHAHVRPDQWGDGGSGGSPLIQRELSYGTVTPITHGTGFLEYTSTNWNPWSTTSTGPEEEEGIDGGRRQQPQRQVKGKGRLCGTGSHIL